MLVYHRIEELRAFGRALKNGDMVLPNVDATLRASVKLAVGIKITKFFEGFGQCEGKIISAGGLVNSTLYPGSARQAYTVKYTSDGATEDLEEEEIRPLIAIQDLLSAQPFLQDWSRPLSTWSAVSPINVMSPTSVQQCTRYASS